MVLRECTALRCNIRLVVRLLFKPMELIVGWIQREGCRDIHDLRRDASAQPALRV